MSEGPEDWQALQEQLLSGDRVAFARLNRLISGFLIRLRAYDFRDEWDDLRQEVLVSLIANARRGRLRDPQAFVGYVRIITRNKFMDRLKRRLRKGEKAALPWDEETAWLTASAAVESADTRASELWAEVRKLPPERSRLVEAVYRQGKTYQEAADDAGVPLGTAKRWLREALAEFRKRLGSVPGRSDPMRALGQTYTEVSCDRAQQIDLLSFVSEPAGEGFAAFRKHYPQCPRCAAEVRAWNELHLALQDSGGAFAHPGAETLSRFEASPTALSAQARSEIESHLSVCPACRDELGALHRFDPARLTSPALTSSGGSETLRTLLGRLRGLVMRPVFAYGVALLLLYPALQGRLEPSPMIQRAEFAREADLPPAAESFGASSLRAERQTLAAEAEEPALQPAPRRARELRPEAALAEAAGPALERSPRAPSALADPFRARFDGPVLHLELPPTARDIPAEVRVIFPEGERELLQRLDPPGPRELALELPPMWLTSGTYRVGYRASGGHWVEVEVERGAESDTPM